MTVDKEEKNPNQNIGDALEVKVNPETMKFVISKIKLKNETIADRTLQPLWLIHSWISGKGDSYDYEVEIWVLRILAHLTRKYNWAIFLLEPENIRELQKSKITKGTL